MTTAKEILKLIETVDPNDTAKLDEIDALVYAYFMNLEWKWKKPEGRIYHNKYWLYDAGRGEFKQKPVRFTKSRDALKAIRPEGWLFYLCNFPKEHTWFQFDAHHNRHTIEQFPCFPTEELAELHAIIQAIEFERVKE